jgi:hypothetical protein
VADSLLRFFVLAFCFLGISFLIQVAWWTFEPWTRVLQGTRPQPPVAVEPVGFLESGKLQQLQGAPVARALAHRLQQINEMLRRDLTTPYSIIQNHLNVSLPGATPLVGAKFNPVVTDSIKFEAKIFNLDVVGIGTFFYNQLYAGDTIRVLVEILGPKSRYFAEVSRPDQPPSLQSFRVDRTVEGDLHLALRSVACDITYLYHGTTTRFAGISESTFCDFLDAYEFFQGFITETAAAISQKRPIASDQLKKVIAGFEKEPLLNSRSSFMYALRASLYKLDGDLAKAISTLEAAEKLSETDKFVSENLRKWISERDALAKGEATSPQVADAAALAAALIE